MYQSCERIDFHSSIRIQYLICCHRRRPAASSFIFSVSRAQAKQNERVLSNS